MNGLLVQVPKSVPVEDTSCDPAAQVVELIAEVAALELPPRVEAPLTLLARSALRLLSDDRPANDLLAVPILGGFIFIVNALPEEVITDEDAGQLVTGAEDAIAAILAG